MNIDDPKLTAFALGELEEPERSAIEREVSVSPEAQRAVDETRRVSRLLRNEFAAEVENQSTSKTNLVDIHDDPWFWSIARPVAIAATIAIATIIVALTVTPHKEWSSISAASSRIETFELSADEKPRTKISEFKGPDYVPNPLRAETIQQVVRVVIGELPAGSSDGKLRVIETVGDPYRLQHLRQRLTTNALSKKMDGGRVGGGVYQLVFLDQKDGVVAVAAFYRAPGFGFVLQLLEYGYARDGHYFLDRKGNDLPADWISGIDYSGYVIPFPDWAEALGYSPG